MKKKKTNKKIGKELKKTLETLFHSLEIFRENNPHTKI